MRNFTYTLFATDVAILIVLLAGVLRSILVPDKRIWPPPRRRSWQWVLTCTCCSAVYGLNLALLFLDWNAWRFPSYIRFVTGIPLTLLGGLIVVWGIITLGRKNTFGLKDGFVLAGPYRFTRCLASYTSLPRSQRKAGWSNSTDRRTTSIDETFRDSSGSFDAGRMSDDAKAPGFMSGR